MRTALAMGPCPCKLGRKEENIDFELPLPATRDGSDVCCGEYALNVARVVIACLYARAADRPDVRSQNPKEQVPTPSAA